MSDSNEPLVTKPCLPLSTDEITSDSSLRSSMSLILNVMQQEIGEEMKSDEGNPNIIVSTDDVPKIATPDRKRKNQSADESQFPEVPVKVQYQQLLPKVPIRQDPTILHHNTVEMTNSLPLFSENLLPTNVEVSNPQPVVQVVSDAIENLIPVPAINTNQTYNIQVLNQQPTDTNPIQNLFQVPYQQPIISPIQNLTTQVPNQYPITNTVPIQLYSNIPMPTNMIQNFIQVPYQEMIQNNFQLHFQPTNTIQNFIPMPNQDTMQNVLQVPYQQFTHSNEQQPMLFVLQQTVPNTLGMNMIQMQPELTPIELVVPNQQQTFILDSESQMPTSTVQNELYAPKIPILASTTLPNSVPQVGTYQQLMVENEFYAPEVPISASTTPPNSEPQIATYQYVTVQDDPEITVLASTTPPNSEPHIAAYQHTTVQNEFYTPADPIIISTTTPNSEPPIATYQHSSIEDSPEITVLASTTPPNSEPQIASYQYVTVQDDPEITVLASRTPPNSEPQLATYQPSTVEDDTEITVLAVIETPQNRNTKPKSKKLKQKQTKQNKKTTKRKKQKPIKPNPKPTKPKQKRNKTIQNSEPLVGTSQSSSVQNEEDEASKYPLLKKILLYNTLKQTFVCITCACKFKSERELKEHINSHVNVIFRTCVACGFQSSNVADYYDHCSNCEKSSDIDFSGSVTNNSTTQICDKDECYGKYHVSRCMQEIHNFHQHLKQIQLRSTSILAKIYTCPICKVTFNDIKLFYAHCVPFSILSDTCILCQITFNTSTEFYEHSLMEHKNKKCFRCHICATKTTSEWALDDHLFNKHNTQMIHCTFCSSNIPLHSATLDHFKTCFTNTKLNIDALSCPLCGLQCDKLDFFLKHLDSEIKKRDAQKFQCKCCFNHFYSQLNLSIHMINSECQTCGLFFKGLEKLTEHIEKKHVYMCE